jgi:anionic cell wall polymer biosynthesis LytR-Cps2A-Psr (LCP) family protein
MVMAPAVSRRQARQARRRQQQRQIGLVGGIAIAVVAVIVIAAVAFGGHKLLTRHDSSKRTQSTLLLQIQGSDRKAEASVLLAHDSATKSGVEVLVPSNVLADVCGYGQQNFGDVLALPNGTEDSQQTLSSMLNDVTVDGSWVLSEAQLAQLINVFGGVTVDVDVNVERHTSNGGGQLLIPAGSNKHLNGAQAVEYALYDTSSQAGAAAEQERLNRVITALLEGLPTDPTRIAAAVRQLGSSGASTLGADKLSSLLAGLAADSRTSAGLFATDLPVTSIDDGGSTPAYQVDNTASGVPQLVESQLANSVPSGADKKLPTVLLLNGVGTPGLVQTACPKLTTHGLAYAGSNNAPTFNNKKSSVEISSDSDVALGNQVAHALGLPTSDVVVTTQDQTVADVIVILGQDYKY